MFRAHDSFFFVRAVHYVVAFSCARCTLYGARFVYEFYFFVPADSEGIFPFNYLPAALLHFHIVRVMGFILFCVLSFSALHNLRVFQAEALHAGLKFFQEKGMAFFFFNICMHFHFLALSRFLFGVISLCLTFF